MRRRQVAMGQQRQLFSSTVLILLWTIHIKCEENQHLSFGALLNADDEADVERKVFDFASRSVDMKINFHVSEDLSLVTREVKDPFDTSKQVCSLASSGQGVAAIFGPSHRFSSDYVRSFTAYFEIPHVEILPDLSVFNSYEGHTKRNFSLSLWPDLLTMRQAYDDLADKFGWLQIIIITSTSKPTGYLSVLTHIMERGNNDRKDVMVQPIKTNEEAVLTIKKYPLYKNVIVDLVAEDCVGFTRAAANAGLLSGYYHYHFTTMDLYAFADAIGPEATGVVNVTTFSLIDYESKIYDEMKATWNNLRLGDDFSQVMTKTTSAVIYDSMFYVSHLLSEQLGSQPPQRHPTEKMNCQGTGMPRPWSHGRSLYRGLTRNVSWRREDGITGKIKLDADGVRRSFTVHLLEFDANGEVRKVGRWSKEDRLVITKQFDTFKEEVTEEFRRIDFAIAVKEEHPAVYINNESDDAKLRYSGFSIDLMEKIAERLEIASYHFVEVVNGSERNDDGSWTGIVGGLMTREYDIGLSPITVTVERSEVIDFTTEYINLGISILYMRDPDAEIKLFKFMEPFRASLWGAIFGAFIMTSFFLHVIGRFSPKQWDNPHPCNPDVDQKENDLGPSNSIWFAIGSFLQQGTEIMPKSTPTRIIATFWWLFCLICVSSYTANLAAFLTKSKMKLQITSADDLARQTEIKYGCYATGSTRAFFEKSTIPTFSKMNAFMVDTDEEYNVASGSEGVQKVLDGGYAYIMESTTLKYELTKNCSLMQIGGDLNSLMYSIALPKYSPYTDHISDVILKLKEDQTILNLYNKWWKVNNDSCTEENKETSATESSKMGLPNFVGVFLVFGLLLVAAFIVLIIEMIITARQASQESQRSTCDEFLSNLKFAARCCCKKNDQKPARWHREERDGEESCEENFYGSLDRLSLSIGTPF